MRNRFLIYACVLLSLPFVVTGASARSTRAARTVVYDDWSVTRPALKAARSGDVQTLRKLVNAHPQLIGSIMEMSGCIGRKLTLLHAASEKGQVAAARFMVSKRGKVNARDSWCTSPLHIAATPEMASFLLSKGAEIEAKDKWGHTPLHVAAESGRRDVAFFLRSKGAKVATIFDAVLVGDDALVRKMLDNNPKLVTAAERDGTTPLSYAASTGQVGMLTLLLDHGAGKGGVTALERPLCAAVNADRVETARALLSRGASANAKEEFAGSVLSEVAWRDQVEMAKLLIEHGADVNAGTEAFDLPPLHNAVFYDHDKMAQLLIAHGADVNKKIDDGRAPLHFAASVHPSAGKSVSVLLAHGADVNAKDNAGSTPLTYSGSKAAVRMLVDHGAMINNVTDSALAGNAGKLLGFIRAKSSVLKERAYFGGRTLMHFAAIGGSVEVTEILIKRGVQVNPPDVNGETPLHFAAQNGNTEVVRVLFAHGAHVNAHAMDRVGSGTPLDYALEAGHKDTADLLRRLGAR